MGLKQLVKKFSRLEKKYNATPEKAVLRKEYYLKKVEKTQAAIDAKGGL